MLGKHITCNLITRLKTFPSLDRNFRKAQRWNQKICIDLTRTRLSCVITSIYHTLISVELYPHCDVIHPLRWPYSQVSSCDHCTEMLINDGVPVKVSNKNLKKGAINLQNECNTNHYGKWFEIQGVRFMWRWIKRQFFHLQLCIIFDSCSNNVKSGFKHRKFGK